MKVVWKSPVASTAFLDDGAKMEKRLGRVFAITFAYEDEEDAQVTAELLFAGAEAFKCTFLSACDLDTTESYDSVVAVEDSAWKQEVVRNLRQNGRPVDQLQHLQLMFDDGPLYEFICTRCEAHVVNRSNAQE
jgi:hypothetical protein